MLREAKRARQDGRARPHLAVGAVPQPCRVDVMPHLTTDDGIRLFYEETGAGVPVVFVHEFAGDHRSYEPQLRYFGRALSLVIAGCGYGAEPGERAKFHAEAEKSAAQFETLGMAKAGETYAIGPTRVQFQNKDPRGWKEFAGQLAEHSSQGSALTMRGVQKRRPSLFDLVGDMRSITAPTLIMTGDEDWPCLEPALLMKRTIPTSALVVLPNAGHLINLEEPDAFNRHIADFFHAVDVRAWPTRDPRALTGSILGGR